MSTTISSSSTSLDAIASPLVPLSPEVPARELRQAEAMAQTVLSGDAEQYKALVSGIVTKKGTPSARLDATLTLIGSGLDYVDAVADTAGLNAEVYREVAASLLRLGGKSNAEIAGILSREAYTTAGGREVPARIVTENRVSQLAKVGDVFLAVGAADGFTVAELKAVASSTAAKALTGALAVTDPTERTQAVVKAVRDGVDKRKAQAEARKAKAAQPSDNVAQNNGLPSGDTEPTEETAEEPTTTEETTDADVIDAEPVDHGSDVTRLVQLVSDAASLAAVIGRVSPEELGKRNVSKLGKVPAQTDAIVVALAELLGL